MKNIWIQHLEKQRSQDGTQGSSFVEMLHSLARLDYEYEVKAIGTISLAEKDRQYTLKSIQEEIAFDIQSGNDCETLGKDASAEDEITEVCTEICRWTAKSQQRYETGTDPCEDDYVRLLQLPGGQLVLRYNVAGEGTFEMEVGSTEEADNLILEDNLTTSELYPANPEMQWSKK